MSTQTKPARLDSNIIVKTLESRYGVGALAADVITIEWAATHLLSTHSRDVVKAAVKRLNAARYKMGHMEFFPSYGHPLFGK